jgi:catechol 2,3-dioxygenase-like lactoylglutathione lyase family enzyme
MLKGVYVIDLIVRDLDAAVDYFRRILGVDPIDTTGIGDGVSEFRMAHFPAPGGGAGLHSIGLFQLTTEEPVTPQGIHARKFLDERGEGVILFGFTVTDIDATLAHMKSQGLASVEPEPVQYQMGRGFTLPRRFGVDLWFAEHHPDAYQKYLELAKE